MVLYQVENVKLLNGDDLVLFGVLVGRLILEVPPLTCNLEMRLCRTLGSFPAAMTPLLPSAQRSLLASQGLLRGAIETRVLNGVALTIRQKGLEANVNTNVRMLALTWIMLDVWLRLTHDEGIPLSIRTVYQVNRLGHPLYRAVQLDLEGFCHIGRHMQMRVIRIQPHIAAGAVLSELERVPAVRLFETGEAHIGDAQLSGLEKAFERFGETISQHLYGGGRHLLPHPALDCAVKSYLVGKVPRSAYCPLTVSSISL